MGNRSVQLHLVHRLFVTAAICAACGSDPAPRDRADASTGAHDADPTDDGASGADAAPPVTEPQPLLTPLQEPPSEPGWLEIRPTGLVLAPGQSRALTAQVFALAAEPAPADSVTWTSSDPAVATVSATGMIVAGRPGMTEITVSDAGRRSRRVRVAVSAEPPTGVTGFFADRPVVTLETGDATEVAITLTSASGEPIAGSVELASYGSPGVTATYADGLVRATATTPGVGRFSFRSGELDVEGTLLVVVPDRGRARPPSCDGVEPSVEGCWLSSEPYLFTAPGQTATLRLTAAELPCDSEVPIIRDVSPTDIAIGDDRVLDVSGGGQLLAVAPGWSAYGVRYRGVACDCPTAGVTPDVNGCWTIECANGDMGSMRLGGWPTRVLHGCPTAACSANVYAAQMFVAPALGRGSLLNDMAPRFECSEPAFYMPTVGGSGLNCRTQEAPVGGDPRWIAQANFCEERGCASSNPYFCGIERSAPGTTSSDLYTTIRGNDEIDVATCRLTRGGACEAPTETSRASFRGVTYEGGRLVISDMHMGPNNYAIEQYFDAEAAHVGLRVRGVTAPGVYDAYVGDPRLSCSRCASVVVGVDDGHSFQSSFCDPSDSPPVPTDASFEVTTLDLDTRRFEARYELYVFDTRPEGEQLCEDYARHALTVTGEIAGNWRAD